MGSTTLLVLYFAYRYATTGDPFATASIQTGPDQLGFSGSHSLALGLRNELTQLAYLLLVQHNWPVGFGLMLVLALVVFGTRERWDWFLLGVALSIMGAYTLYFYHGLMHGPRFWFEALPMLMILTARGLRRLAEVCADLATTIRETLSDRRQVLRQHAYFAITTVVLLVAAYGSLDWLVGDGPAWRSAFVPHSAKALRGFNGANSNLLRELRRADLHNALVLVERCPHWQCYGSVYWLNAPRLDGEVIYATWAETGLRSLLEAFPDRALYVANYHLATVKPYRIEGNAPEYVPLAREVAARVPDERQERDRARQQLLADLAGALQLYYLDHGTFPETEHLQSLCVYPADVGCALKAYLNPWPARFIDLRIQYIGGTEGFLLVAKLELPPERATCPVPLPAGIRQEDNPYCLIGKP
jgi:hypothetical protein